MARQVKVKRKSRAAARRPLTVGAVVASAVRMAQAQGVEAVSMRAIAADLGVEAMSLYTHVPSKDVLLGLMASHVINTVPTPSRALAPKARLMKLALGMRAAALAYPNVFPLVVLRPLELPASVRPTEIALQAFADAGLDDREAIGAQRIYLSYVRGYVLWELGGFAVGRSRGPDGKVRPSVAAEVEALDGKLFPQTRRLARTFFRIMPDRAFAEGLDCILGSMLRKGRGK